MHPAVGFLLLLMLCFSATVETQNTRLNNCLRQAKADLEEIYCRVKAQKEGSYLPSLADFRRNSADMQVLLLKRPAHKLGLILPTIATTKAPGVSSAGNKNHRSAKAQSIEIIPSPADTSEAEKQSKASRNISKKTDSLWLDCKLQGDRILCPGQRYQLISNMPNSLLLASALGPGNQLQIPGRNQPGYQSDYDYLTHAYELYIDKMLSIGLGAATMSFTRFHQVYSELQTKDADFQHRFATMFEYLKADKRSSHAPKQLTKNRPANIESCNHLNPHLIICDNGKLNWLYMSDQ